MFQRARVISLPRRADRREILDLTTLGVPWEFRDGVDIAPIMRPGPWAGREGHLGCLRAHRAVLEEIVADGMPTLVLEDDAVLHPEFVFRWHLVAEELRELPPTDLLYLGGQQSRRWNPTIKAARLVSVAPSTWRTHAYAVTPAGARVILTAIAHNDHARTIDGLMAELTYRDMLRGYACSPWLISVSTSASDTGAPQCPTEAWSAASSA